MMARPRIRLTATRRRLAELLLLLAAAGVLLSGTPPYDPSLKPGSPPYLTIFLLDGLSQPIFERELDAGRLPQLRRMIDEGVYVRNGIGAFPSVTGFAFHPFLTGTDAAEGGVLGLRWFDRDRERGNFRNYVGRTSRLMNADARGARKTVFEHFPDRRSYSVNSFMNRGVQRSVTFGWSFAMAKYRTVSWLPRLLSWIPLAGERIAPDPFAAEALVVQHAIDDLRHLPKIQWITLASLDAVTHIRGIDGEYTRLLRHLDAWIGKYRQASVELGTERQRIYAVVSDHGVVDVGTNLDLGRVLAEKHGLRHDRDQATHLLGSTLERFLDEYGDTDVIVAVNGNTMNFLYLRDPRRSGSVAWRQRLDCGQLHRYVPGGTGVPIDLVETLRAVPGIELVACREAAGSVALYDALGRASIRRSGDGYAYDRLQGDPLGYERVAGALPLLDGRFHPAAAWLQATAEAEFPYGLVRLHALVSHPSAGELTVTSSPGHDLASDFELVVGAYRGGHGGLRGDQMRVPYLLSGPGVPRRVSVKAALAEDVGATLFALLGLTPPRQPLFEVAAAN